MNNAINDYQSQIVSGLNENKKIPVYWSYKKQAEDW